MVVRHWRQEWRYEAETLLAYEGANTWARRDVPAARAARRLDAERAAGRRFAALRGARALAARERRLDLDQRRDLAAAAAARVQRAQGLRRAGRHQPPHHHADRLGAGGEQPQAVLDAPKQPLPYAARNTASRATSASATTTSAPGEKYYTAHRAVLGRGARRLARARAAARGASRCARRSTRRSSSCRSSSTPTSSTRAPPSTAAHARAFVRRTLQEHYLN